MSGVALLDRECLSQSALILAGLFEPREADWVHQMLRARFGIKDHLQPRACIAGQNLARHAGGVIAFGPKQPLQQLDIFLCAAGNLGDIGFIALSSAKDSELIETISEDRKSVV